MDRVQGLEGLLESWTQLVEQSCLTREDSVTAARWSLDHAEKSVRGRIHFKGMICVIFSGEVTVSTDISPNRQISQFQATQRRYETYPSRPIIVTCLGSC